MRGDPTPATFRRTLESVAGLAGGDDGRFGERAPAAWPLVEKHMVNLVRMPPSSTARPDPRHRAAWVIGASSGIGRDLALALAAEGFQVTVSARRVDQLNELVAAARPADAIDSVPADVTDPASVDLALDEVQQRGPVDVCIISAGTYRPMNLGQFTAEGVSTLLDVNFMGAVRVIAAVLPGMLARRAGHIVVIASVAGYRGLPSAAAYGASKAALINLCESLHLDLRNTGVRIQLVNPGFVRTPLTDRNRFSMPFLMDSGAAARRIVRGLSSSRFEITFPRRFTWMLKALRLLPYGLYFRLVGRTIPSETHR